jgi:hypothetical protein
MLEKEQKYYEENREELRKKYAGKEVIIIGEAVFGAYDTVGDAYEQAKKIAAPGSFMIKSIPFNPDDEIIALSPFVYG